MTSIFTITIMKITSEWFDVFESYALSSEYLQTKEEIKEAGTDE